MRPQWHCTPEEEVLRNGPLRAKDKTLQPGGRGDRCSITNPHCTQCRPTAPVVFRRSRGASRARAAAGVPERPTANPALRPPDHALGRACLQTGECDSWQRGLMPRQNVPGTAQETAEIFALARHGTSIAPYSFITTFSCFDSASQNEVADVTTCRGSWSNVLTEKECSENLMLSDT